jgi:hypothetical protein
MVVSFWCDMCALISSTEGNCSKTDIPASTLSGYACPVLRSVSPPQLAGVNSPMRCRAATTTIAGASSFHPRTVAHCRHPVDWRLPPGCLLPAGPHCHDVGRHAWPRGQDARTHRAPGPALCAALEGCHGCCCCWLGLFQLLHVLHTQHTCCSLIDSVNISTLLLHARPACIFMPTHPASTACR